ncbi:17500_t:CDS:2 [Gigaspora margarita]|uniref:17500_t:CDS:1 n=1 Tax=Gigaspora margarita TaxID=4874 RepID=A0ABN7UC90_GIGMA|nr:17500_t:CDS:2 [Gigaspora margarita]
MRKIEELVAKKAYQDGKKQKRKRRKKDTEGKKEYKDENIEKAEND